MHDLMQVQAARQKFLYYPELKEEEGNTGSGEGSATDLIMLKLCQHVNALANE